MFVRQEKNYHCYNSSLKTRYTLVIHFIFICCQLRWACALGAYTCPVGDQTCLVRGLANGLKEPGDAPRRLGHLGLSVACPNVAQGRPVCCFLGRPCPWGSASSEREDSQALFGRFNLILYNHNVFDFVAITHNNRVRAHISSHLHINPD